MEPQYQQPGTTPPTYGNVPQQPIGQSPTQQQNPYGFILDTQHRQNKNILKGGSLRSRLLLVVGGGLVLIIATVLISSVLTGSSKARTTALISIAAEQQEITRVIDLGAATSKDPSTLAFAEITKLSISSQQQALVSYLKQHKVLLTPKLLAANLNSQTDAALKAAAANDQVDSTLNTTLRASLTAYEAHLQKSYRSASGAVIKNILASSIKSTTILLK